MHSLLIEYVRLYTGYMLNVSSSVNATASSSYEGTSGVRFVPQLAVQADTGYVWANCFISTKQPNPWFRLEFKSVTFIFNVRLGVKNRGAGKLPAEYSLSGMASLSVRVGNSPSYSGNTRCGGPWTYNDTKIIDVNCGRTLRGKFVHFLVPSSSRTYLMICSIVINRYNGTVSSLVITVQDAQIDRYLS